ncbi:PREDICTED: protein DMR6-LIKE OXYGENASE 1-like [Prunus mume]|uniref:Protein DMR6-LIKE OXYGENASE 1-like n=1 Tax=Prunus mume TaxID=102107 RepID=A0ABM1LT06_PRUMU|nr:PREDICTED: protein DMR6-LIKE OXYGENASE 1-like [Prunus mume]
MRSLRYLDVHFNELCGLPYAIGRLTTHELSQACEEYGFFQIIDHGVPEELCYRKMAAMTQFFKLPAEERAQYFTTDHSKPIKLFNYYLKLEGDQHQKVTTWSETFSHLWEPLNSLPEILPNDIWVFGFSEVFAECEKEIGALVKRLLGLISQGLGPEEDCLQKKLGENPTQKAQGNYYPPYPDPDLTLGQSVHTDLNALTILWQTEGVTGLQVLIKDEKWVAVDPLPSASVINLAIQGQVLSNGRYKSVHHRAVTNKVEPRLSIAMFYGPSKDTVIGPIEDLIDEEHPPLYWSYKYANFFFEEFYKQEGKRRLVKEAFEFHN